MAALHQDINTKLFITECLLSYPNTCHRVEQVERLLYRFKRKLTGHLLVKFTDKCLERIDEILYGEMLSEK